MIYFHDVNKSFGNLNIFHNLNLKIERAGIHIIEGKSGSGKSTFLNLIMGQDYDSGTIDVLDQPIYIRQNYDLIPSLTVRDNLLLGKKQTALDYDLIEYFDMRSFLNNYPDELSGGQKQRVGIIRSLMQDSSIILCDEPTESLDIANKKLVMDLLLKLSKTRIVIVVSHDTYIIQNYGDYFYSLKHQTIKLVASKEKGFKKVESYRKALSVGDYLRLLLRFKSYDYLVLGFSMVLFILGLGILCQLYTSWFEIPSSKDTVNADIAYIKSFQAMNVDDFKNTLLQSEMLTSGTLRPILEADAFYYDGSKYLANIYPHPSKTAFQGVYLNTNAKELLGDVDVGSNIEMVYRLDGKEYLLDLKVTGFVQEPDTKAMNVYYDYDLVQDLLLNMNYGDLNRWEFMLENCHLMEIELAYEKAQTLKRHLPSLTFELIAPLYDERINFAEDIELYARFYSLLYGVLVLSGIGLFIFLLDRQIKKLRFYLGIFMSNGYHYKLVLKTELIYLFICLLIVLILGLGLLIGFSIKPAGYYLLSLLALVFALLLTMLFKLKSIDKSQIMASLKEGF